MDDIVRACGLSAGAVYGHFKSKDELILAAVTDSLSEAQALLRPLRKGATPPPAKLARRLIEAISAVSERDGLDLKRIAVLDWGEAPRNPERRAAMRRCYEALLSDLATYAERWRGGSSACPSRAALDIARALLSLILGFIAASAIVEDAHPATIATASAG
jgi:AcrR family transcriptional regulator